MLSSMVARLQAFAVKLVQETVDGQYLTSRPYNSEIMSRQRVVVIEVD